MRHDHCRVDTVPHVGRFAVVEEKPMTTEETPLPYDETTSPDWLDAVNSWPWQQSGSEEWVRSGHCPRCEHAITTIVRPIHIFTRSGRQGTPGQPTIPPEVFVGCNCGMPHPGRPDDKIGCGQGGVFAGPPSRQEV